MIKIPIVVFTVLLLFSIDASSNENEYFLNVSTEKYTLSEHKYSSIYNNVYGIYQIYLGSLFGKAIHLFPTKKFAIQEYCDICKPKTIATGNYSFINGNIEFNYEYVDDASKEVTNEIKIMKPFTGVIDKGDYVTGDLFILVSVNKLEKLNKEILFFDFYIKTTPYLEWKRIQEKIIIK